jgi:hypothetical protein
MPKTIDNSLITMYSPDQDATVSVLPTSQSNVSNMSEWVKVFAKTIGSYESNLDTNSIWLAMSYADANSSRLPVSVDEKIVKLLVTSKQYFATLQPEVRSLISSFSNELGLEPTIIEHSFNHKILYDEIEYMIRRVGVKMTFRLFFKLFNCRMLRMDRIATEKIMSHP